jgi:uncharacterized protein YdaU (DUF1376 family)
MKVRFVQLESEAFLTDIDFMRMSAAERGVYVTLLFYLYCNGAECEFDPQGLGRLCNCEDFSKIWSNISKKFQTRNGVIKHKRVTKELKMAKKFIQHQRKAGLTGASKRWRGHSAANSGAIANETKGNVIEKESKALTNTDTSGLASSSSDTVRPEVQALYFNQHLTNIIRPRSQSDRTCFRNVTNWLTKGCAEGMFTQEIFARVLDLADEAKTAKRKLKKITLRPRRAPR